MTFPDDPAAVALIARLMRQSSWIFWRQFTISHGLSDSNKDSGYGWRVSENRSGNPLRLVATRLRSPGTTRASPGAISSTGRERLLLFAVLALTALAFANALDGSSFTTTGFRY